MADAVLALDDELGLREARVDVALGQREMRELLLRLERIEDRRQQLGAEPDALLGGAERFAIRGGEQRDRLGVMADLVRGEHRLIVGDER